MEYYHLLITLLTILFLATDGFPMMLNDTETNSTKADSESSEKVTNSSNHKIKFTALYLFSAVWLLLIAMGFGFYWFLYYMYPPKRMVFKKIPNGNSKRKGQMLYSRINQRYHKNKRRKHSKYMINKVRKGDDSETSSDLSNFEMENCPLYLNSNFSNSKDAKSKQQHSQEEKSKKGGCCCGKFKKKEGSQATLSKESADVYKSQPLINLYNQPQRSPQRENTQPPTQTQMSRHSVSSQPPPPVTSNSIQKQPSTPPSPPVATQPVTFQSPIQSQPQPMYHNYPPAQQPIQQQMLPQQRPPTAIASHHPSKSHTKSASVPVQSYGGSTNVTDDDQEKTVAKTGCCANKKKSNGQIHAQIHGYRVDGHVHIKGKNNKQTISIPTDTYNLNG